MYLIAYEINEDKEKDLTFLSLSFDTLNNNDSQTFVMSLVIPTGYRYIRHENGVTVCLQSRDKGTDFNYMDSFKEVIIKITQMELNNKQQQ